MASRELIFICPYGKYCTIPHCQSKLNHKYTLCKYCLNGTCTKKEDDHERGFAYLILLQDYILVHKNTLNFNNGDSIAISHDVLENFRNNMFPSKKIASNPKSEKKDSLIASSSDEDDLNIKKLTEKVNKVHMFKMLNTNRDKLDQLTYECRLEIAMLESLLDDLKKKL